MKARKYLERLRSELRELKWMADKSQNADIKLKAAWCADYTSELLDRIDDDLLLRTWIAKDCDAEVRYSRKPASPREIATLIEMLKLTEGAFDRETPVATSEAQSQ